MTLARGLAIAVVVVLAACGGSTTPASPTPDNPNQMVISSSGVLTPKEITIAAGSRVLFINNDARPHFIASDPHPEHDQCREMDPVGVLSPGQRRETSNFVTVRTCGLHDHDDFTNKNLQGTIIVR